MWSPSSTRCSARGSRATSSTARAAEPAGAPAGALRRSGGDARPARPRAATLWLNYSHFLCLALAFPTDVGWQAAGADQYGVGGGPESGGGARVMPRMMEILWEALLRVAWGIDTPPPIRATLLGQLEGMHPSCIEHATRVVQQLHELAAAQAEEGRKKKGKEKKKKKGEEEPDDVGASVRWCFQEDVLELLARFFGRLGSGGATPTRCCRACSRRCSASASPSGCRAAAPTRAVASPPTSGTTRPGWRASSSSRAAGSPRSRRRWRCCSGCPRGRRRPAASTSRRRTPRCPSRCSACCAARGARGGVGRAQPPQARGRIGRRRHRAVGGGPPRRGRRRGAARQRALLPADGRSPRPPRARARREGLGRLPADAAADGADLHRVCGGRGRPRAALPACPPPSCSSMHLSALVTNWSADLASWEAAVPPARMLLASLLHQCPPTPRRAASPSASPARWRRTRRRRSTPAPRSPTRRS